MLKRKEAAVIKHPAPSRGKKMEYCKLSYMPGLRQEILFVGFRESQLSNFFQGVMLSTKGGVYTHKQDSPITLMYRHVGVCICVCTYTRTIYTYIDM